MSSTVTIQNTVNWAQGFLGFAPLALGAANEPALTSANMILQTILNPPFKWRWNRGSQSFVTNASTPTQDYAVAMPNFGSIENAFLSGQIELEPHLVLAVDSSVDRPAHIAPQLESPAIVGTVSTSGTAVSWVSGSKFVTGGSWNGLTININGVAYTISSAGTATSLTLMGSAGTQTGVVYSVAASVVTVTFRLQPVPPITPQYTVTVNYQQAAPAIAALAGTWAPVPDYLSSLYCWGFLSLMQDYFGNAQAARTRQIFVATILGLAEGLTEQERNIFASAWLGTDRADLVAQMTAQLGERGRGI